MSTIKPETLCYLRGFTINEDMNGKVVVVKRFVGHYEILGHSLEDVYECESTSPLGGIDTKTKMPNFGTKLLVQRKHLQPITDGKTETENEHREHQNSE